MTRNVYLSLKRKWVPLSQLTPWVTNSKDTSSKSPEETINKVSPWNRVSWLKEELESSSTKSKNATDQRESEPEEESPLEDASLDRISESSPFPSKKKEKKKSQDWPMMKDPWDWDQRECPNSEDCSKLKRLEKLNWIIWLFRKIWSEENGLIKMVKRDKRPLKSRDWSPGTELSERENTELKRNPDGKTPKNWETNTRKSMMPGFRRREMTELRKKPRREKNKTRLTKRKPPLPLNQPIIKKLNKLNPFQPTTRKKPNRLKKRNEQFLNWINIRPIFLYL